MFLKAMTRQLEDLKNFQRISLFLIFFMCNERCAAASIQEQTTSTLWGLGNVTTEQPSYEHPSTTQLVLESAGQNFNGLPISIEPLVETHELSRIDAPPSTQPSDDPDEQSPSQALPSTQPTDDPDEQSPSQAPPSTQPSDDPDEQSPSQAPPSTQPTDDPDEQSPSQAPPSTQPSDNPDELSSRQAHSSIQTTDDPDEHSPSQAPPSIQTTGDPDEQSSSSLSLILGTYIGVPILFVVIAAGMCFIRNQCSVIDTCNVSFNNNSSHDTNPPNSAPPYSTDNMVSRALPPIIYNRYSQNRSNPETRVMSMNKPGHFTDKSDLCDTTDNGINQIS